jgi:ribosomal protein S18 acetylase RimI-like enzyme
MSADESDIVRPFDQADVPAIRRLAEPELGRSAYRSGPAAAIDALVTGSDPDTHGLVAIRGHSIVAFVIHGSIAGAEGAGRLQLVVTDNPFRRMGIARRLVEVAVDRLRGRGARFVIVELPDDPALAPATALLHRCGFLVDARVRDFYRDGVDLAVFRLELTPR